MSFLFGRPERRSGEVDAFLSGDPMPQQAVTPTTATYLAPVFASIRHIVDFLSTLGADFYESDGTARRQIDPPPLIQNIDEDIGFGNWLGQLTYGLVTVGNTVGKKSGLDWDGKPALVEWADRWSGGEEGEGWWLNGQQRPTQLVAHVPWIVPTGKRLGLSPIGHSAAVIAAGLGAQEYANVRRGGGLPPSWVRDNGKRYSREEAQVVKQAARAAFASGDPFVMGKEMEFGAVAIPPAHKQFIETLKISATQVAAIYGIDPREVGGEAPNSLDYINNESRGLDRLANLRPYVVRLEQAVNRMLPAGKFMKLNVDSTIRTDIKTRTEVMGMELELGLASLNQLLAKLDRPPVAGGDAHRIPSATNTQEGTQP